MMPILAALGVAVLLIGGGFGLLAYLDMRSK
jgi:hypothetical protein